MSWILIRNGHLFAPEDRGVQDLLVVDQGVVAIGSNLAKPSDSYPVEIYDAQDRIILPGLIDPHIHIIGASGLRGPASRTTDLQLSRMTRVGVTTIISPLGTDCVSRTIPDLLARAMQLDAEGITAYCYTGGWRKPLPTLTGEPLLDVTYLERVLGIKVAIAEANAPHFSVEELSVLAHAAIIGGKLAGKKTILHTHIGDRSEGLHPLEEVADRTGLPVDQLVATHVNRNPDLFEQALEYGKRGGSINLTTLERPGSGYPRAIHASQAVLNALDRGVLDSRITISTDSGAAFLRPNKSTGDSEFYMAGPDSLLETVCELVKAGLSWSKATSFATKNTADLFGLTRKGRIEVDSDADVLILTPSADVDRVYCRGRLMVKDGKPIVRGLCEEES